MTAAIFSNQFVAVWTALFALGNSGLAFLAMENRPAASSCGRYFDHRLPGLFDIRALGRPAQVLTDQSS